MSLVDKLKQTGSWFKHKVNQGITIASLAATMSVGAFSACKDNYCETDMDCTSDQLCEENTCYSIEGASCETDLDCLEGLVCENRQCVSLFEQAENTKLPENDPNFQSVELRGEQPCEEVYFTFSVPANTIDLQVGDIMVGSSDGGYLCRVESIERDGNSLLVSASQASLTDAIENGSLRGTISLGSSNKSGDYATREQNLNLNFSGEVLYSQSTGTGQYLEVRISDGSLRFTPDLDLDASISMFRINRFSAIASGVIDLNVDVEASMGGRLTASREIAIGVPYVQPFAFSIGPVPVVGTATLQLYAGFSASSGMAGEVTAGFDCNASLEFGAVYSDGDWTEIWEPNLDCNAHSPELGIEGRTNLEMYLRPELRLMVYGVAGPSLDVKPYLEWEGNFTSLSNWNWELAAGLSGNLGYRLAVFGRGINRSFELFDWRNVIASDSSGGTTCSDECSPAGNYCSGDDAYSCTRGTDGCLDSRLIDSCTSNEHCESGSCVPNGSTCSDECSPAGNYCSGDDAYSCTRGTDGCLDSRLIDSCTSDEHCDSGECVDNGTGCVDECEIIGIYCGPSDNVRECYMGSDGCLNEYILEVCSDGCTDGECDTIACTDECTPLGLFCSGNDLYQCGYFDSDPCKDISFGATCDYGCSSGRCNDTPASRFENMGDGTVRDNDTGRIWQQSSTGPGGINRDFAVNYCNDLTLGGSSDWTLPSSTLMRQILDESGSGCMLFPEFEGSCGQYWVAGVGCRLDYNYTLNFGDGSSECISVFNHAAVRCIKN